LGQELQTSQRHARCLKLAILEYARRKKFPINEFVEVQISSRKKPHQRGIDGRLERLAPGDRLIVSELSRLGRSLGQVIHIVDELVKRKIRCYQGKHPLRGKAGLADQGSCFRQGARSIA
jgi:DNA invertase Pin-like site-specific DNA recombinase